MGALIGYAVGLSEDDCDSTGSGPSSSSSSSGPSVPTADFDHTFVQSTKGDRWGCWGRDEDDCKREIVNGGGNHRIKMARCLAEPNGTAGIVWSVTGMCHQAANRILFPAHGITVSAARGYAATVLTYGVYGSDYPLFLTNVGRCKLSTEGGIFGSSEDLSPIGDEEDSILEYTDEFERRYQQGIRELYSRPINDEESVLAKDLELIIQKRCEYTITQNKMKDIQNMQVSFQRNRRKLINSLSVNKISKQEYLFMINTLLKTTLIDIEKIIGEKKFIDSFDSTPDKASDIFVTNIEI
ncbi:hypothetical protein [Bacillus thuringiensis]|uniref:hypothetical protein n=1 Tax=Bacillus thuringiensis TaxID=1428 RepID=UPI000BF73B3B|nr:hypothetical protein [Bacillus thuringiensis]PFB77108.1 hypothetical protein CN283_30055 [Bacillus thuringiensis]PGN42341.1 hypothetical protein CN968_14965 [Bacillus thuringiensis]